LVNLALQGGGAHGAFSWGVLDRLLEDGRIGLESISGTSAGAMNAVVVVDGLMAGGPDRAREKLAEFWRHVSLDSLSSPIRRSFFDMLFSDWSLDHNPALIMIDMVTRVVSPYQFNPFNINPLKDLLEREVDFDRVRHADAVRLFISATNVQTGRVRVFSGDEVTADAVMASACLPFAFQAVEIDGVPYWDGGYMGNPVLYPFYECRSQDVVLVQTIPITRKETPRTAREIMDRLHEISFNASLIKELTNVEYVNRGIRAGTLSGDGLKEFYLHAITCNHEFEGLSASSKLNAEWAFLLHLRDLGRRAAAQWIALHYDQIGRESSLDFGDLGSDAPVILPRVKAHADDGKPGG
jgi:NTE family protein